MSVDAGYAKPSSSDRRSKRGGVLLVGVIGLVLIAVIATTTGNRVATGPTVATQASVPALAAPPPTAPPPKTPVVVLRHPPLEFANIAGGQLWTLQGHGQFLLTADGPNSEDALMAALPGGWVSDVGSADTGAPSAFTATPIGLGLAQIDGEAAVRSYAWHDSRPSLVAEVRPTPASDTWDLATYTVDSYTAERSDVVVRRVFQSERWVRAWDDSGFVVAGFRGPDRSPFTEFLDASGETVWQRDGFPLDVSPAGAIVTGLQTDESWTLHLVPPEGSDSTALTWAPPAFQAVRSSIDGNWVAFLGPTTSDRPTSTQLDIYRTDGNLVHSVEIGWHVWDVQWSADNRFILMPGSDDIDTNAVVFYDTETDTVAAIDDFETWVQWSDLRD